MKISKELVSEVFKLNIYEAYIENNILYFDMGLPLIQSINLYEFAFKCKEWILNKGYSQLSGKDNIYEKRMGFVCSIGSTTLLIEDFYAGTEIEAIIKACEWILSEVNK